MTARQQNRDFVRVGCSRIAGTGVFAKREIPRGTRIIEYTGKRLPPAQVLIDINEGKRTSVYIFRLNETTVIDGASGGNEARFINHSCAPNCEANMFDNNMYIYAMADIACGDELTFDYQLSPALNGATSKKEGLSCHCGAPDCRGTMLSQKLKTA